MGLLTTEMTRLCEEIVDLREGRQMLLRSLARGAKELKETVFEMQSAMRQNLAQMARNSKTERSAFLFGLKKEVSTLRKEVATDLAGAHRAWSDLSAGPAGSPRR